MSSLATFDGIIDQSPPFMPATTTGGAQERGLPIFRDTNTREPEPFDPWNLKKEGRINSTVMATLAEKGHGKTTTNIVIATRLGARRAGTDKMRLTTDDHRRDDGTPEYEDLTKFFGTEQINLAEYQLNILDMAMGMKAHQQLGTLKACLEYTIGRKLKVPEAEALRYGLKKVRKLFPKDAELGLLSLALRNLGMGDVVGFQADIIGSLAQRHGNSPEFRKLVEEGAPKEKGDAGNDDQMSLFGPSLSKKAKKPQFGRQTKGLLDAAAELASMIEELIDGEYGQIFGGQHSLVEAMSQRMVAFDYSGLSEEAIMLMQTLMWEWKTAALVNKDKRFQFDIEIHDENYTMWQYPVYARAMHKYLKQIRSYGTFVIMSTHRLADYRTVGKKSSREYQLANNMLSDVGIWLIGKLDRMAAEEAGKRLRLSETEVEQIQGLTKGNWGLKIGSEAIRWVTVDLTPDEIEISASDGANDRMAIV